MNWRKIADLGHKCLTIEHPFSGWKIQHCGHPTANWPYYLISPDGLEPIVSHNGRGFRHLPDAKAAVAHILCGTYRVTQDGRVVPSQEQEEQTR